MASFKDGALLERTTSTVTSGSLVTLVFNSTTFQRFTGSTAQTVQLPDATTMAVGLKFVFQNRSTALLTINDGSGSALTTVEAGYDKTVQVYAIGSVAGTWDVSKPVTLPVPLIDGGTGTAAASANAAFNALSPMTTAGDTIYGGTAGAATRLGVGANGNVLTIVGGIPAWQAASAGSAWPSFFCTAESDLTSAISGCITAGGGIICLAGAFTISAAHTIPAGTTFVGRMGGTLLTLASSGSLTLATGAIMEKVWLTTALTSGNMLNLANGYANVRNCQFTIPPSSTGNCIYVTGNSNKMYNNVFVGVLGETATAIQYFTGIDNADFDSAFLS